jgi:hypothetical protein
MLSSRRGNAARAIPARRGSRWKRAGSVTDPQPAATDPGTTTAVPQRADAVGGLGHPLLHLAQHGPVPPAGLFAGRGPCAGVCQHGRRAAGRVAGGPPVCARGPASSIWDCLRRPIRCRCGSLSCDSGSPFPTGSVGGRPWPQRRCAAGAAGLLPGRHPEDRLLSRRVRAAVRRARLATAPVAAGQDREGGNLPYTAPAGHDRLCCRAGSTSCRAAARQKAAWTTTDVAAVRATRPDQCPRAGLSWSPMNVALGQH